MKTIAILVMIAAGLIIILGISSALQAQGEADASAALRSELRNITSNATILDTIPTPAFVQNNTHWYYYDIPRVQTVGTPTPVPTR